MTNHLHSDTGTENAVLNGETARMQEEVYALKAKLVGLEEKLGASSHSGKGRSIRNLVVMVLVIAVLTVLANAPLVHGQSVVDALFISQDGNVGIGTTSPATKLDVNGAITAGGSADANHFLINGVFIQQYLGSTAADMYLNWYGGNVVAKNTLFAGRFVGNGTIPVGGIIMWSGSVDSIPAGWALCNGTQGTPDLRDRFVVGAGRSYSPDNSGGSISVKLDSRNLPDFSVKTMAGTTGFPFSTDGSTNVSAAPKTVGKGNGYETDYHQQDFANDPIDIRPPYYALAFIMRTQ